jgi:outer membrane protein insertion porin family
VERPIITKINFSGNKEVRLAELREAVSLKEKDVFISAKVASDERTIRDLYLKKGFTDITVSSRTEEEKNGFQLTFTINEGASTIVSAITFQGNRIFTERVLKGQLVTKEAGFLRKGVFQEAQLEQDRQIILAYYQDRGYIDTAILDISREFTFNEEKNQNELAIVFRIQEGVQYTYAGTTFTGNVIFPTDRLQSLISLKPGDVFNQTKFQAGIMAVADLYYENGYTANSFVPEMEKDSDRRSISYNFTIAERPRSHIENIIIRGNNKTRDYVILRELPIESGDIFSKAKITNGLRNLFNLQFFSAIVPDIVPGSEENLVDLVLNVEEQSTVAVEFGLTFSGITAPDTFPVSLFLTYQDSNIAGTGKTGSVNTTLSPDQQSLTLGYGDSWLFGLPVDVSVSFGVTHKYLTTIQDIYFPSGLEESYYMNYRQLDFSLSAGIGRRWFPEFAILRLAGGVSSSFLRNFYETDLYEPYDSTIADYASRWGLRNSFWTSFSLDDRDINYDPGKGWFASQYVSWTGLLPREIKEFGEKEFFLRTDTKGEIYFTLLNIPFTENWALKLVLAGLTTFSFQFPAYAEDENRDLIGETSKLYIDGMFIGRGWGSGNPKRGKAMWSSTVELRLPVVPGLLAIDGFFDAVALKPEPKDLFSNLSINDFRFSYGPGIRFSMPQFPLRLLFTWGFSYVDDKFTWRNGKNDMQFVLSFNIVNR